MSSRLSWARAEVPRAPVRRSVDRRLAAWALAAACLAGCRSGGGFEAFDAAATPSASDYPDAPRVVLLKRGVLRFGISEETGLPIARLERYLRVKLLRPEEAAGRLALAAPPQTPLKALRAQTIRPDGSTIAAEVLPNRIRPDRQVVLRRMYREATPGAVLEARWVRELPDPRFIPPWVFDGPAPTLRSEFIVELPHGISADLRASRFGNFTEQSPDRFETERGTRLSWTKTKLPAAPREPQMFSPQLIAPKAELLFLGARIRGQELRGFDSWDAVGAWLLSRLPGWAQLSPSSIREAKRVAGDTSDPVRAATRLAEILARDLPPEQQPPPPLWRAPLAQAEAVLNQKRANPTTRGLLLVALLRAIGVDARPALYARQEDARIAPDFPTVMSLYGVAAALKTERGWAFIDPNQATQSTRVPAPELQGARVVLLDNRGGWVETVPRSAPADSQTLVRYLLQLNPKGEVWGEANARLSGAEAGALRTLLAASEPADYPDRVTAFLASRGAQIPWQSVNIRGLSALSEPLELSGRVRLRGPLQLQPLGSQVALARLLGAEDDKAPSHSGWGQLRRSPVRLGPPHELKLEVSLQLPANWFFRELTEPYEQQTEAGSARLSVQARGPSELQVLLSETVTQAELPAEAYPRYRQGRQALKRALDQGFTLFQAGAQPEL